MNIVHDVLDKLLVDRNEDPMGRVDGLMIAVDGDNPPRVTTIECGAPVLGDRLHPRIGRIVRAIGRRFGLRRGQPIRIAWSKVKSIGIEVKLDTEADRSASLKWEHWLREHVMRYIPFSGYK
jgi:hypothetical protein